MEEIDEFVVSGKGLLEDLESLYAMYSDNLESLTKQKTAYYIAYQLDLLKQTLSEHNQDQYMKRLVKIITHYEPTYMEQQRKVRDNNTMIDEESRLYIINSIAISKIQIMLS